MPTPATTSTLPSGNEAATKLEEEEERVLSRKPIRVLMYLHTYSMVFKSADSAGHG
ncbi:hypothetical protein BGZ54_004723, partial [Gamsiella multidivaricata]